MCYLLETPISHPSEITVSCRTPSNILQQRNEEVRNLSSIFLSQLAPKALYLSHTPHKVSRCLPYFLSHHTPCTKSPSCVQPNFSLQLLLLLPEKTNPMYFSKKDFTCLATALVWAAAVWSITALRLNAGIPNWPGAILFISRAGIHTCHFLYILSLPSLFFIAEGSGQEARWPATAEICQGCHLLNLAERSHKHHQHRSTTLTTVFLSWPLVLIVTTTSLLLCVWTYSKH